MKLSYLTATLGIAALALTACGNNEPQSAEIESAEETTPAETEHRPAGPSDVTDQLDVDQWTGLIQDDQIVELNEDGVPINATDNE